MYVSQLLLLSTLEFVLTAEKSHNRTKRTSSDSRISMVIYLQLTHDFNS